jgi:hypothetical protein
MSGFEVGRKEAKSLAKTMMQLKTNNKIKTLCMGYPPKP